MQRKNPINPSAQNTQGIINGLEKSNIEQIRRSGNSASLNLSMLTNFQRLVLGTLVFMALPDSAKAYAAAPLVTYLLTNGTNYKIQSNPEESVFNQTIDALKKEFPEVVNKIPLQWELIKKWASEHQLSLWRGADQDAQNHAEVSMLSKLDEADNELTKRISDNSDIQLYGLATIAGVIALIAITYLLYTKISKCIADRRPQPEGRGLEEGANHSNSKNEEQKPLLEEEEEENPYMKQLKDAGINTIKIAEHPTLGKYVDPVTLELIIDPVLVNDGNVYERETAQSCKDHGLGCPKSRDVKITYMYPDNKFKADMVTEIENVIRRAKYQGTLVAPVIDIPKLKLEEQKTYANSI